MLNDLQLTSVELLLMLIRESVELNKVHHLLCDEMFQRALDSAKECDVERNASGKKNWTMESKVPRKDCLPPFFGVPISVKESFRIKGKRSTIGFIHSNNPIATDDSLFIAIVREMGFIPFVRTNIPQNNMSFETCNNIYGRTNSPWNKERTPGGSSGGEGGLICSGGSVIGVGSDIGGSCRIPAAFCGLYTLMSQRYSKLGEVSYGPLNDGILNVRVAYCPITKSVKDLVAFTHEINLPENYTSLKNPHLLDPYLRAIPFDLLEYRSNRKLVIGVARHTDQTPSSACYLRAVDECIRILSERGY